LHPGVTRTGSNPTETRRVFLEDRIEYRLPFGWLGHLVGGWLVRRKLRRMFDYRHETTLRELADLKRTSTSEHRKQ